MSAQADASQAQAQFGGPNHMGYGAAAQSNNGVLTNSLGKQPEDKNGELKQQQ